MSEVRWRYQCLVGHEWDGPPMFSGACPICVPINGGEQSAQVRVNVPDGPWQAYGEQCADTDGLAAIKQRDAAWVCDAVNAARDTDGTAMLKAAAEAGYVERRAFVEDVTARITDPAGLPMIPDLRDANTVLNNRVQALETKLIATMDDAQSIQRKANEWEAECKRLSALLVEKDRELAQRMAMPARALRFGK